MTRRIHQKDTEADQALYRCLNSSPPQSFMMIAGAGSGKTTSLIKGLGEILRQHGKKLKSRRQKVACITFTEVAAGEIWADVGNNPLIHVSTIHSFLWSLVRPFQSDIKSWVSGRIDNKLEGLRTSRDAFSTRVKQSTRDKNELDIQRYTSHHSNISRVASFTYGTGSDYSKGILGHDDVLTMVPQFISERPLMRRLIASQFPFVFVDESQDTTENVVNSLRELSRDANNSVCIGFFGDPMQRIYLTGIGSIAPEPDWVTIKKTENFRCPRTVLDVANAIRVPADSLEQVRGRMSGPEDSQVIVQGSARLFIFPLNEQRTQRILEVRAWTAAMNIDPDWNVDEHVKVLVIVHRMAAKRLGFANLYSALNDSAPESIKGGFLDGTAWPVRPFISFVVPLVRASRMGDAFEVMRILRGHSPLLARENLVGIKVSERLAALRDLTNRLDLLMSDDTSGTVADVINLIRSSNAFPLDQRILACLDTPDQQSTEDSEHGESSKSLDAMRLLLACRASEFLGYYQYINDESPFSTQQGIKGAEFERVLVIVDDDEGTHNQFSYEKYLGIKKLSSKKDADVPDGKETSADRTRRLFYVCCTRALKDLAVVLFTEHVDVARTQILANKLFPEDAIHLEDSLKDWLISSTSIPCRPNVQTGRE